MWFIQGFSHMWTYPLTTLSSTVVTTRLGAKSPDMVLLTDCTLVVVQTMPHETYSTGIAMCLVDGRVLYTWQRNVTNGRMLC